MIANVAFAAALTVFLMAAWLAGELSYLARYKASLFTVHGPLIGVLAVVVFLNLTAAYYGIARRLFLRDTGRKLTHLDQQLGTPEGLHRELRAHLAKRRR